MDLDPMLARLGRSGDRAGVLRLLDAAGDAGAPADWRRLAAVLADAMAAMATGSASPPSWLARRGDGAPLVLGIAGAQGSGKSTLAAELIRHLTAAGTHAVACSLDDFYLSRGERWKLAADVHPLFATRGVPGTHHVGLLERVIDDLGSNGTVALPGFDKGADEPLPRARWRRVEAPVEVLVLEGWCVAAEPQSEAELVEPVNDLEAVEDPAGVWRRRVNTQLAGPYRRVWDALHGMVFLRIPDWGAVRRWRGQQEQALPPERRMGPAALERFVAHYQRLTLAMHNASPRRAGLVGELTAEHRLADLRLTGHGEHSESIQRLPRRMPPA